MTEEGKSPYEDIIDLPHHVSQKHPPMDMEKRAAQFMPFRALTGHEEAVAETARLTERRIELSEEEREDLDRQLKILEEHLPERPLVQVTYFLADPLKEGGSYEEMAGRIRRIDPVEKCLMFADRTKIPLEDILSLEGEILSRKERSHV
jgi:hypothetical protein